MIKIIVTGSAGFIGFSLCLKLLRRGDDIVGIDNQNDYYDPKIKEARVEILCKYPNYKHYNLDITDRNSLDRIFEENNPEIVINLAAQAGVRYSMENPSTYIQSKKKKFAHILENCRKHKIEHLV